MSSSSLAFFDSIRTTTPEPVILLRLFLAALLGGIIGLERELKRRPAGLRTHMLVAMGAALFTVITFELVANSPPGADPGGVRADPVRIVEAVTAGVAFLAAGAIIQSRGTVQGVTTGASMWLAAALGVACGAGDYTIAIMATVLTIIILAGLSWVERRILGTDEQPDARAEKEANRKRSS